MKRQKPRLSELTLREKIGQTALMQGAIFMNMEDMKGYLKENPIGEVWHNCNTFMLAANLADVPIEHPETSEYYRKWARKMPEYLKVPPLIANDGPTRPMATDLPGMQSLPLIGANDSEKMAENFGKLYADNAKALGVNWVWMPCVDIASRFSAVSIMRTFSDKKEKLVELSNAFIKGAQEGGIAMTIKHFPGADKEEYRDAHYVNTYIRTDLDEWRKEQGWVFKKLIEGGVHSVMVAHNAFPAVDDTKLGNNYIPASLSHKIVTGLLKEELGFEGVVITDAIDMGGLKTAYPDRKEMLVALINAGNDVLLNVKDLDYIDIIEKAVKDGRIAESRIDDACTRILNMKEKLGLFEETEEVVMTPELYQRTTDFNQKVAENALTLECDLNHMLPLDPEKVKNVAIICSCHSDSFFQEMQVMKEEFEKRGMKVRLQRRLSSYDEMHEINEENDLIIYASYVMPHNPMGGSGLFCEECETFLFAFTEGLQKSIGVSMGSCYVYYDYYMNMNTYVHAFSCSPETQRAFVKAIFGEIPFRGKIPYIVPWKEEQDYCQHGEN